MHGVTYTVTTAFHGVVDVVCFAKMRPPKRFTRSTPSTDQKVDITLVRQKETVDRFSRSNDWEERHGFSRILPDQSVEHLGWLVNMHEVLVPDPSKENMFLSGSEYYFLCEDGSSFKCLRTFEPYFFVMCKVGYAVTQYLYH